MRDDTIPATEILVVGGRSYAFGLRWTSAATGSAFIKEATAAAIAEGANFVALHRGYGQFGLASVANTPTGIRGLFYRASSGVAAVAAAAGSATLAAFPLDDGRWLVMAIDRKGILPDGDQVVRNADEAKALINGLITQSPATWRRKFVPADWGIADAKTVDPKTLLSGRGEARLLPIGLLANGGRIRLVVAASAIVLVTLGFAALRLMSSPPPVAIAPFQPPRPIAALWTPAGLTLDACLSALREAQRYNAVPGWVPTKYTCQAGQSLVIDFSGVRDGQISLIRSLLPAASLSDDGHGAVLAIPLKSLPRISAIGGFAAREQYRVTGLDLSQRLNGIFTLQAGQPLLPGESDVAAPNQAWKPFTWTYQTQAPAIVWAGALARLGAISIETLVFNPSENLWQITGSLYASR